jgi:hypothetical protein
MPSTRRRIGPVGIAARVASGLGLIYLAGAVDGRPWDVDWYDPIVGFVVLPAATLATVLCRAPLRERTDPLQRAGTGWSSTSPVIVALLSSDYTAGGAVLFYGASMLLAAWLGQPGCETTVVSNLVLRRNDQLGCPVLAPLDEVETRLRARDKPAAA